jgi:hypothetical protein
VQVQVQALVQVQMLVVLVLVLVPVLVRVQVRVLVRVQVGLPALVSPIQFRMSHRCGSTLYQKIGRLVLASHGVNFVRVLQQEAFHHINGTLGYLDC